MSHDAEKSGSSRIYEPGDSIYLEETSVETDGSDLVKFADADPLGAESGTHIPIRGMGGVEVWLNPSSGETIGVETAPTESGPWQPTGYAYDVQGGMQRVIAAPTPGHYLRVNADTEGGDLRLFVTETVPPFWERQATAHKSFSTSGSWQIARLMQVPADRTLTEIVPYWRDTGGGGNATDWLLHVARDTGLDADSVPVGPVGAEDGWFKVAGGQVSSGDEGPVISSDGYTVSTHAAALLLRDASSGSTTGIAQLQAREDV